MDDCRNLNKVSAIEKPGTHCRKSNRNREELDLFYYVNKNQQANGDYEVHTLGCSWLPSQENRTFWGDFTNCQTAVQVAKQYYPKSNGCYHCSNQCHTT